MKACRFGIISCLVLALVTSSVFAGSASLNPDRDNTLYEDLSGSLSNGAGNAIYSGQTGPFAGFVVRRAVLRFDVAGSIPAGSVITSATLTLEVSKVPPGPGTVTFDLHRLTSDWGEGTSDTGISPGGGGAPATAGDATWIHTFSPGSSWGTAGGDFSGAVSATQSVTGLGSYSWTSSQLRADVQDMLDDDSANFGWIIIGDEVTTHSARQFDSREGAIVPVLDVEYADTAITACGIGATNVTCGGPEDVLFINGSAGGAERTLDVTTSTALSVTMEEPTSRQGDAQSTLACTYVWVGTPDADDIVSVPKGLGEMCYGPWIIATKNPAKIWNAIGFATKLGTDNAPGPPPEIPEGSCFELLSLPGGFGQEITVTFQGLLEDNCSQGTVPYSVTNGIVLNILP